MAETKTLAEVLAAHADCALNEGADLGSYATGVDAYSCGIVLPFADDLEEAERGHIAAAVTAHLAAILADPETVEAVARAYERSFYGEDLPLDSESTTHARAAIAVIATRQGVAL